MPSKEIEFKSIHIYNNSDVVDREDGQTGKLAEEMAMIDMVINDRKELDTVILSKLKKIVKYYNELISNNSEKVELKHRLRKGRGKAKKTNKPQNKVAFVDMFNIKTQTDLNKTKTIKAIRKYAEKQGIKISNILGGIGRSLTIRARK